MKKKNPIHPVACAGLAIFAALAGRPGYLLAATPLPQPKEQVESLAEIALKSNDCSDWTSNGTIFVRKDCTLVMAEAGKGVIEAFLNDPEGRATRALRDIAKCPEYTESGTILYRRACVKAQAERAAEDIRDFKDDEHPVTMTGPRLSNPQIAALIRATSKIEDLPTYEMNGLSLYRADQLRAGVELATTAFGAFVQDSEDYERQLNTATDCPKSYNGGITYQQRGCANLLIRLTEEGLADLGDIPVIKAVKNGDLETLVAVLALGESPDSRDFFGNTALTLAVAAQNEKMVRVLLDAGADPSLENTKKQAPIELALLARSAPIARLLKKAGADLTRVDANGNSVLMQAMAQAMWDFALSVIDKKCVNLANKAGETPLSAAMTKYAQTDLARELLEEGADPNSKTPGGIPLLVWSVGDSNRVWFDLLMRYSANVNQVGPHTALTLAIALGKADLLDALLAAGADASLADGSGRRPLVLAACQAERFVTTLFGKGAKPNLRSSDGQSAIHCAIQRGLAPLVPVIVGAGGDVELLNPSSQSPLWVAASIATAKPEVVDALLKAGAATGFRDSKLGWTPLQSAVAGQRTEIVSLLLKKMPKSEIDLGDKSGSTAVNSVFDVPAASEAVRSIRQLLLDAGADVNLPGHNEFTPLFSVLYRQESEWVDRLVKAGADVNLGAGTNSQTPLMLAAYNNDRAMVEYLISVGAKADLKDLHGLRASDYAKKAMRSAPWLVSKTWWRARKLRAYLRGLEQE